MAPLSIRARLPRRLVYPPPLAATTAPADGRAVPVSSHRVSDRHDVYDDADLTAPGPIAIEPPARPHPLRLRAFRVLLAASTLVAIAVLLEQVGNPEHLWDTTRQASLGWAALALVVAFSTNLFYAIALMGTLPLRLPLWPTTEVQVAMSYSNLVIPVIGGTGVQIRFLRRQGAAVPAAVVAGGLLGTVGTVGSQLPLLALAIWLSPDSLNLSGVPLSGMARIAGIAVLILVLVSAATLSVPGIRRTLLPPLRDAAATIWSALTTIRRLGLLVGGNLAVTVLYGFCLFCCLRAFGGQVSFWTVLAVSIAIGKLAGLVAVPGGAAAVGSVGLVGILTALGVAPHVAVAAALANQLATNYLPAAPGWFATQHLLKHDYL